MLLVLKGAVRAEYEGGRATLLAGSLFLAPPGSRLRTREGAGAILKSFFFGPSLVDAFASESSMDAVIAALSRPEPRFARLQGLDLEEAASAFSFLEREASQARPGYLPIIRLKVMELVLLVGGEPGPCPRPGEGGSAHFKAEDLKRFIEERYADRLSLDDLAAHFGLNPAYLSRAFRKGSGSTIVEQVNKVRIRKSCLLLKKTESAILDIALCVGYNNLSHFNRYFRRLMGMSPREFRRRSRK
jgi:AraC-like DNA-binding protein